MSYCLLQIKAFLADPSAFASLAPAASATEATEEKKEKEAEPEEEESDDDMGFGLFDQSLTPFIVTSSIGINRIIINYPNNNNLRAESTLT